MKDEKSCFHNIGVLGGAFNPPHMGHLHFGRFVVKELKLDRLLFVVTNNPPHKVIECNVSSEQRLEMVKIAIKDDPLFLADETELNRPEISYTIDTLDILQAYYSSDCRINLIIGSDQALVFSSWKDYQMILAKYPVYTICRSSLDEKEYIQKLHPKMNVINTWQPLEVSSSMVRVKISNGLHVDGLIPTYVNRYISNKGLYHD